MFGNLLHIAIIAGGILSLLNHFTALLDTIGMHGILGIQTRYLFFPLHWCHRRGRSRCRRLLGRHWTLATKALGLWHLFGASMALQMRGFALGSLTFGVSHVALSLSKERMQQNGDNQRTADVFGPLVSTIMENKDKRGNRHAFVGVEKM